ncbi:hypothetical protein GF406_09515 [candidate division KSB1 bacterium]|nr:hypothetical protein [candidate division KSB1 bacterium]
MPARIELLCLFCILGSFFAGCGKNEDTVYLPGQIIVDSHNPAWLVYNRDNDNNGRLDPAFICGPGDPEGFLYRGNRNPDGTREGDQEELIEKLAAHGGNCIYMIAVRTHGGDAWKSARDNPKVYPDDKHNPWIGQDPARGVNTAILDQWDEWFSLMDENGIIIYFFIYDDAIKIADQFGWALDADGNLNPDEKSFVQTLVNRFEHHKNLVWCVMEEGQEIGQHWRQHISQIARAVREADDHDHVIAAHQLGGNIFYHAEDPHIDQFAIQTSRERVTTVGDLHDWMLTAWETANGRYSLNMSEDAVQGNVSVPNNDRTEIRQRNWTAAMAGAYSMVLGMNIDDTPAEWLTDCKTLYSFFESTTFNMMHPADSLAAGETMYVLAADPFDYIAYSSASTRNLGLHLTGKGEYTLKWIDCISGKTEYGKHTSQIKGEILWHKPSGFGNEVAVFVQRTDRSIAELQRSLVQQKTTSEIARGNIAPVAENKQMVVKADSTVYIQLLYDDPDGGPGPYTITIVSPPEHGELSGRGNDRYYTPDKGYTGQDQFSWQVSDGEDVSGLARMNLVVR